MFQTHHWILFKGKSESCCWDWAQYSNLSFDILAYFRSVPVLNCCIFANLLLCFALHLFLAGLFSVLWFPDVKYPRNTWSAVLLYLTDWSLAVGRLFPLIFLVKEWYLFQSSFQERSNRAGKEGWIQEDRPGI